MALSTLEKVLLLKGAELFRQVPAEQLVPLADVVSEVVAPAGAHVLRQGDPGDCLYVVVSGEIAIELADVGRLGTRGPGETVGELGVLSDAPRTADCFAVTDSMLLRIGRHAFRELAREQGEVALGVIDALVSRLTEAVGNLTRIGAAPTAPATAAAGGPQLLGQPR